MAVDLTKMNEKELTRLRSEIDKEMGSREKSRKTDARKAAEDAARKHGFSLDELLGGAQSKPKRAANLPPKFRNPDDESQTWSGRGRQPEWYKSALSAGKTPEDLSV